MGDSQDSSDEIQSISQRLRTVTTIDNNINIINTSCSSSANTSKIISTNVTTNTRRSLGSKLQQPAFEDIKNTRIYDKKEDEGMTSCSSTTMEMKKVINNELDPTLRNLPELNVTEKILLIIDVTQEVNCTKFKLETGATYMPMFMIKRVLEIFVGAKSMIKRNHEFAVMTLNRDSIKWICDFTNNIKTVLNTLDSIIVDEIFDGDDDHENNFFDLSQIFETLNPHVPNFMDECNMEHSDPPPFITRAILIYSRSNCIPVFENGREYFDILSNNPYFILDCLFVHEPPSEDNKCEEIYNELTTLDVKNLSYILEVGRNAAKLHDNMAKLLAHPLQRPLQKNASYNISLNSNTAAVSSRAEEIQTNV